MDLKVEYAEDEKGGRWSIKMTDKPGVEAYMTHVKAGTDKIIIDSTVVPDEFSGKGVGKTLLKAAIEHMRKERLKTIPTCPFVKAQLHKNSEWHDILDPSELK